MRKEEQLGEWVLEKVNLARDGYCLDMGNKKKEGSKVSFGLSSWAHALTED